MSNEAMKIIFNERVEKAAGCSLQCNVVITKRMFDLNGEDHLQYIVHYMAVDSEGIGSKYQGGYYDKLSEALADASERVARRGK